MCIPLHNKVKLASCFNIGHIIFGCVWLWTGFLGSAAGKEYACNSGDPGLIPGLGSVLGEGIGYPLQYSWASMVAQMVKNHLQCGRPGFDPWVEKIP